jgi:TolA-binding protein
VSAGPGYATRRQEAVAVMMQLTTAMPEVMSQTVDLLVKQLDMPGGKALVDRLHKLLPPQLQEGENGQPSQAQQIQQLEQAVQQMSGQLEALNSYAQQAEQAIQELRQRNNELELQVKDKTEANALKARELEIEREYNAWQIGVKEQELALKAAELQRNGQEG